MSSLSYSSDLSFGWPVCQPATPAYHDEADRPTILRYGSTWSGSLFQTASSIAVTRTRCQTCAMRFLGASLFALLGLTLSSFASVNFTGTWVLDLKASDSPDPMMKRMGVSALERKLAASTKLEATYSQSADLLTITTRGPGFSRTEHLRLDDRPEAKTEKRTGPYTIRTSWSHHGKELISTSSFRTKDGKNAELVVTRKLTDAGNTLVLSEKLKIEGKPHEPVLHRVWRRKA